jgi:hypothetical protein
VNVGQDGLEVIGPSAICDQLANQLITFALNKEFIAIRLREVHATGFFCVVHIEEDFWHFSFD